MSVFVSLWQKNRFLFKEHTLRKIENIKPKLAVVPLILLLYLLMYALDTTCIVKSILGIPCPGCGMTRAVVSALRLDLAAAFRLHPMFWSLPLLVLYFLYDGHLFKNKRLNYGVGAAIALGFLLNWLIRIFYIIF